MFKKLANVSFVICFLLLYGCAGTVKNMQIVPPDKVVTKPAGNKSMVIFLRPSSFGFAIQSSVFEIVQDDPKLVGILAAKKKLTYELDPGKHLFMVIGESADFMSADIEANKVYYAIVSPRMGVWKARFSLEPIHEEKLNTNEFSEWLQESEWVEKSPESDSWATDNMNSIRSKQQEYYKDWMDTPAPERPILLPQDGRIALEN